MLRRKVYDRLVQWKEDPDRLSLLVKGPRQIGKTFLIQHFAKNHYKDCLCLDFHSNPELSDLFNGSIEPDKLVPRLEVYFDREVLPGETLLFFDEIQVCSRARASLKYFSIDKRYHVIASGSLLGVKHRLRMGDSTESDSTNICIPLGYEDVVSMHALDFEEFLWANGVKPSTVEGIRENIRNAEPFNEAVLEKINRLFMDFMIVGGMPEAVQRYVDSGSYKSYQNVHDRILEDCRGDILKYAPASEVLKTSYCFDSIPNQLSESNKKFHYSRIDGQLSRKAASTYSENLLWIRGAGYGNFCMFLNEVAKPLVSKIQRDSFKVYFYDTGLLMHHYGPGSAKAILEGDMGYNFGALVENVVMECLVKSGMEPMTYRKNSGSDRMELDFVIDIGGKTVVVEVKSGRHREHPSLSKVDSVFKVDRKIRLGMGNIHLDGDVECYPLFAAAFMDVWDRGWDDVDVRSPLLL